MGLLTEGTPLSWEETKELAKKLRLHAIKQFIYRWNIVKDVTADDALWGDEIECTLVKFDHERKQVKALLSAEDVLNQIEKNPSLVSEVWHPEFAKFMIEGVPAVPYNGLKDCAEKVEATFRKRRTEMDKMLKSDETIMTLGTFPRIGCQDFSFPSLKPDAKHSISGSIMYPDEAIFLKHHHFSVVVRNIVERRGDKPPVLVPVFKDENTPTPFRDDLAGYSATDYDRQQIKEDFIYMDSVPFGPSCCSLQVTMECKTFAQAMHLCDQLISLSSIFMALSASTPIFRGMLADADTRWDALRQALDDRTAEERGEAPSSMETYVIPCSRCDSMDMYIDDKLQHLNDVPVPYCLEAYNAFLKLTRVEVSLPMSDQVYIQADVHPKFAQAMAHLLIRDPLQSYKEQIDVDDHDTVEYFEDIHMFHWRTGRVKLPPKDGSSGWKIEFRPTEIQLVDSQNAAFAVFIYLTSRLIRENTTEFALPITKVFSNMAAAGKRDAVRTGKFWWRTNISRDSSDDFAELSIDEIINGKPSIALPGVAPLVEQWVDRQATVSDEQKQKLRAYISLIRRRANGSSKTNALWIREFVRSHADYRRDSVVPENVVYDMLKLVHDVNFAQAECDDLVA